ncbi:MAG: thioredoxin [Chloroflexi bacterium]|nr:thioredoxin [Chloroflexota bacterium]
MTPDFIMDVSEADFEYKVLTYSRNVPVVVDFWATWCRPCKVLSPLLEQLAVDAKGSFRLARVDVDQNPNLTMQYNIRSIPTLKAFSNGEVVADLVGAQPEPRLREFLTQIIPPSLKTLSLEKASNLLEGHQWQTAEGMYREFLGQDPDNPAALLGLVKALLAQGQSGEALQILRNFPASRQYAQAELILPLAEALKALQQDTLPDETDLDAAFRNSIRLATRGNYPAALDGMLGIIKEDKRYRNGVARQVFLGILEILGEEDELSRQYRTELASLLF